MTESEFVESLKASGLILPDRSLVGDLYAESELWAYIRSEARQRRESVPAYRHMFSPNGAFDEDMARDVISAVVGSRCSSQDRETAVNSNECRSKQMLLFLKLV